MLFFSMLNVMNDFLHFLTEIPIILTQSKILISASNSINPGNNRCSSTHKQLKNFPSLMSFHELLNPELPLFDLNVRKLTSRLSKLQNTIPSDSR